MIFLNLSDQENNINNNETVGSDNKKNSFMPIVALILGIISIVISLIGICFGTYMFVAYPIGIVLGIGGIIISAISLKKSLPKKGMAIGELITSILGVCFSTIFLIGCLACYGCVNSDTTETSTNNNVANESVNKLEIADVKTIYNGD